MANISSIQPLPRRVLFGPEPAVGAAEVEAMERLAIRHVLEYYYGRRLATAATRGRQGDYHNLALQTEPKLPYNSIFFHTFYECS